jgi:tRNA dimethylallyltransferase
VSAPLLPSLVGATASGKTSVAVDVAAALGIEVISADSRQVYRRLDAGTAKPTPAERAAVPHHLVDVADPEETYTAARFGVEARRVAGEARVRGRVPLLVGGSGLYLRAAEQGLFEGPAADPELRARLADEDSVVLHAKLAAVDAETAARLAPADRVRVIRALEVWETTGEPMSAHHRRHREAPAPVRALRFGIDWEPVALLDRIERRVDAMLAAGWVEEVDALVGSGLSADAPAWKALGYREIRDGRAAGTDTAGIRDAIVTATRQFAKRQRTWFRAVEGVMWLGAERAEDLAGLGARIAAALREARD